MRKDSIFGIFTSLIVMSIFLTVLWSIAANDSQKKYEQLTPIIEPKQLLQKKGFLTDSQIYQFISDCHEAKGLLEFDRTWAEKQGKIFYELRCNEK